MRKILSIIRWNVVNTFSYLKNKCCLGKAYKENSKTIFFDLKENPYHRYLGVLLLFFRSNGYTIKIRYRPGSWGTWSTSLLFVFNINFKLVFKKPEKFSLWFTDHKKSSDILFLSADYFTPATRENFHIPMCMVDTIYTKNLYREDFSNAQEKKRRIKIFFAGRFSEKEYSSPLLKNKFSLHTRQELREATMEIVGHKATVPEQASDVFNSKELEVVLVNRDIYNVPAEKLRPLLSECDFFLAFPGVVMPLCHNIIEAMSAGCIPILQYAEWMHPHLQHKENCLSFSSLDEYKEMISFALNMDEENKLRMRKNIFEYYYKYLTPEAVVKKLESINESGQVNKVLLNAEYGSVVLIKD